MNYTIDDFCVGQPVWWRFGGAGPWLHGTARGVFPADPTAKYASERQDLVRVDDGDPANADLTTNGATKSEYVSLPGKIRPRAPVSGGGAP